MKRLGNELHCIKHEDPGHGWLGVKIELVKLVRAKISPYSYQRGKMAYLEEDCDAKEFLRRAEACGFKVFIDYRRTNKRSPIRSYDSFSHDPAQVTTNNTAIPCYTGDPAQVTTNNTAIPFYTGSFEQYLIAQRNYGFYPVYDRESFYREQQKMLADFANSHIVIVNVGNEVTE